MNSFLSEGYGVLVSEGSCLQRGDWRTRTPVTTSTVSVLKTFNKLLLLYKAITIRSTLNACLIVLILDQGLSDFVWLVCVSIFVPVSLCVYTCIYVCVRACVIVDVSAAEI